MRSNPINTISQEKDLLDQENTRFVDYPIPIRGEEAQERPVFVDEAGVDAIKGTEA